MNENVMKRSRLALAALLVVAAAVVTPLTLIGSSPSAPTGSSQPVIFKLGSTRFGARFGVLSAPPVVGQTIYASPGTWSNNPTQFVYQWRDCDSLGANCANITGATSSTLNPPGTYGSYTIVSSDVGHTIRVVVTASNTQGAVTNFSAQTAVVTGPTGTLLFAQTFETGPFTTPGTPGSLYQGIQAGNWSGQSNGAKHYFGDGYIDNGSSTPLTTRGTIFNLAGFGNVPPGDGSNSWRTVTPIPPTGDCPGCPAGQGYNLESTAANGPQTTTSDVGQTKYYGLMFYLPVGDNINSNQIFGSIFYQIHWTNADPPGVGMALHTAGGSGVNGTANSVVLALESGACNSSSGTEGAPGCQYRSNADAPQCSIASDPNLGTVHCLPGAFIIPPGQLQYGTWEEVILGVDWESTPIGSFHSWYKTKAETNWHTGDSILNVPTIQWDFSKGCCGYPVNEHLDVYLGLESSPFQMSFDDQVIGTTLGIVQAALPTSGGTPPVAPVNTSIPTISGSTQQGQTLTASPGTWTGSPTPTFSYQWQRCDGTGANCVAITGAPTTSAYVLASGDVGHTIKVSVTGMNSAGSASASSTQSAIVTGTSGQVGTGPSQASCPSGGCTAIQMSTQSVSVPDGAGKNYNRSITTFYPGGLSGSVPVVFVFGDGQPCTAIATCVDGSQAFFNIAQQKKLITIRVACTNEQGKCVYNTPDVTPYVASIFNVCGTSGSGTCNDSVMVQYLIQTWIPANIQNFCTGGPCSLDSNRVFVTGGSKGSAMVMQQVCSSLTATLISGAFANSTTAESAATTTGGPPLASAVAACPYHLQFTAPSTYSYTAAGHSGHILMMGYEDGTVDQPQAVSGLLLSNGHWQYSEDQQVQYMTGPDYGCGSTFSSQTLTPAATGFSPITGHVYSGCSGSSREAAVIITKSGSGGTFKDGLCHAGDCDGLSRDPTTFGNDAFQYGPEMWQFWTTGTLF